MWMVTPGADIQGAGWDRETAEAVAGFLSKLEKEQRAKDRGEEPKD
jgi:hypothetical protein